YEVGPFLSRAISMSAGLHLDVFDFVGNEALAEEVRDLPRSGAFPPSVANAGIDLLLNFARRQEVSRAERLVDEVAGVVQDEKVAGWHAWQWKMRLAEARAAAKRIAAALPDEAMRRRFEAAEPVRLLGSLD